MLAAKRALLIAVMLMLAPVAPARALDGADVWNSAEIAWKDMRTGVRETTESGKTALLLFQAKWCSACKMYRKVFKDPEVVAASRNLVMILVDIDQDPKVNGAFSPDGVYVPRTIFVDATGDIRHDLKGGDPKFPHSIEIGDPSELLGLMKRAAESTKPPAADKRAENAR